jgi:hypothetical protein
VAVSNGEYKKAKRAASNSSGLTKADMADMLPLRNWNDVQACLLFKL